MNERFWLVAHDKPGLLIAMMKELAGDAWISFEGDLSRCRLTRIPGATQSETDILKRITPNPIQEFVVIPLETETMRLILDEVLPEGRVVHDIIHVQIEKSGKLAFGAYDNFHSDCIVCWPIVPVSLLDNLVDKGVLKTYELASCAETKQK
ncbi:MAG: hypothetical protein K8R46_11210 [Pirellulales bacterium]|nr:hypothetical protein [Pirellulales bacterium]